MQIKNLSFKKYKKEIFALRDDRIARPTLDQGSRVRDFGFEKNNSLLF
jgi:hypothetical protein